MAGGHPRGEVRVGKRISDQSGKRGLKESGRGEGGKTGNPILRRLIKSLSTEEKKKREYKKKRKLMEKRRKGQKSKGGSKSRKGETLT